MVVNNSIDKTALEKMRELLGAEFPAVISGFLADSENYIKEIAAALQSGDRESITKIAHKMKSGAGQLGFLHMQKIATTLEHNKEMNETILLAQHAELKEAYAEAVNFLKLIL